MSRKRKQYSAEFKAKVAFAAIRNEETAAELSSRYGVHPAMVSTWKRALLKGASDGFERGQRNKRDVEAYVEKLYKKIGQLKVESDFLEKGLSKLQ